MTQSEFNNAFQEMTGQQAGIGPHDPRYITDQMLSRDRTRTRVLAFLSVLFWLIGTAGLLLLVVGLNRFVMMIRLGDFSGSVGNAGNRIPIAPVEDQILWGTSLIHHSIPFVEASIISMMLAGMFTVMLIFSSRQATLNRINVSLLEMSNQLKRGPESGATTTAFSAGAWERPRHPILIAIVAFCVLTACVVVAAIGAYLVAGKHPPLSPPPHAWQGYPILSPFQAVTWQGETPWVQVDGTSYELYSINDLPVKQIIDFSKSLGPSMWRKHFEEDLVELMTKMGNPPGRTVNLRLARVGETPQLHKDVPMTTENRWAIWRARNASTHPVD